MRGRAWTPVPSSLKRGCHRLKTRYRRLAQGKRNLRPNADSLKCARQSGLVLTISARFWILTSEFYYCQNQLICANIIQIVDWLIDIV
jgi:hypothetical protein